MLREVALQLDQWMADQDAEAREGGWRRLRPCTIKVLGQTALMEANVSLTLAATKDVDVYADYDSVVEKEFARLLSAAGRDLDPVEHEIWMPGETQYAPLFKGSFVQVLVADPEAVLISKALRAPAKNGPLIVEYLATGASDRFLKLAAKYHVDLEQFL